MYEPETILALKEPRSTASEPFPYDRVVVVGQSPVVHGMSQSGWGGAEGQGVLVRPAEGFGPVLDEPVGKLRELYKVESVPDHTGPLAATVTVVTPGTLGESPEEVFARQAASQSAPKPRRGRPKTEPVGPSDSDTPEA